MGSVTPPPSLEPTEQPNITESEPESKKLEKEEEDDEYDREDKEDYVGGDEDHDYEEKKREAKESDQGMWKTRVLPEEGTKKHKTILVFVYWSIVYVCSWNSWFYLADFKERFTTHASKNEEDSGLRTLGTSPSLQDEEPADIYHRPKDSWTSKPKVMNADKDEAIWGGGKPSSWSTGNKA